MANDTPSAKDKTGSFIPNADFLIRGSEYLARQSSFKLVGRDQDLKDLSMALMRKENNNVVLYGPNGVGASALAMGLQASKDLPDTPFDIVGKRFFWLDTDALFSSGDTAKINEGFQKALATLTRSPDTVLVMDDVKDFLDGCRNSGTMNLINALMREIRNNRFQVIMEARDENLGELFKAHSDIGQIFTFKEVEPPTDKATLRLMLNEAVKPLEQHHGIHISEEAISQVIDLTLKYPGLTLNVAQPKRSLVILEGALTAYRYKAHTRPLELDEYEEDLAIVTDLIAKGKSGSPKASELDGKSPQELEAIKLTIENHIRDTNEAWAERQKQIRAAYGEIRDGETRVRELEDSIAEQRQKEDFARKLGEEYKAAEGNEGKQKEIKEQYFNKYGEPLIIADEANASTRIANKIRKGGFSSEAITRLEDERAQIEALLKTAREKFTAMTRGSEQLVMDSDLVLNEFSKLSRIPMNKLQQDETAKLLNLETTLKERVFGQDEAVEEVAKAVRRGRTGLKKANKPIGSFLFLGPSGVGKTELGKALAAALFGDEAALETYNMSEYMEKHAVSSLIGAPPGYDGYDAGGLLTNNMRRKPYVVNVIDEAEKAHKDVFDIFLQVLDEGKLKDRRGVEASFANAVNIFTVNVGGDHFLDETPLPSEVLEELAAQAKLEAAGDAKKEQELFEKARTGAEFERAEERALADLWDRKISGFRPEFLNRFTGIFCFNRLGQLQILMIAGKALKELNGWVAEKGIKVVMTEEDKKAMCKEKYVPRAGGRGIMNYIERNVTTDVAETILRNPEQRGTIFVKFDETEEEAVSTFVPEGAVVAKPANENLADVAVAVPAAAHAANAAFKPK